MELKDLNKRQLHRLYRRIYDSLPDDSCGYISFGWDWRTLHSTYPAKWLLLRSVAYAHDHVEDQAERKRAAFAACEALVLAYRRGEQTQSIDWMDIDDAHELARRAIE